MMLTVQIRIGSVEDDCRNGNNHSRYHGYMTGAHKRDAAIGHANAFGDHLGPAFLRLSQVAVTNPTSTASPASNCGDTT